MGFKDNWKRLVTWWAENAKSNEKKLSSGFSWLLVVIISNLMVPLISMLQGVDPNWSAFFIVLITATVGFGIMLIESIFGRREAPSTVPVVPPEPVEVVTPT